MTQRLLAFAIVVLMSSGATAQIVDPSSTYTALSGTSCRTVKATPETGSRVQQCSGAGNYSLLVLDDDDRMSLTVVSPDRKEHPLDLWTIVTKSFSSLGARAEWRVRRSGGQVTPVALIVRVNASIQENPDKPEKRSYLAVAKITGDAVCVTDRVDASRDPKANETARKLADAAQDKPCLQP